MKSWMIVLVFSLMSFVPVSVIGWMNMPNEVKVEADPVKYLKPAKIVPEVITLKEVVITEKRVKYKKKVEEKKEPCFMQESMNGGEVRICP